jgi:hypothetical protein
MKKLSLLVVLLLSISARAAPIPYSPTAPKSVAPPAQTESVKKVNWSGKSLVMIYDAAKKSKSPAIKLLSTVMVTNVIDGAAVADFLHHENNPDAKRVTCETGLERSDVATQVIEGIRKNQEWMDYPAGVAVMASYVTIFCKNDPI